MSPIFPIDLFPTGALSSSVVTTVWVGVFVVVMLNLRLGTTLSGLVVPGYLVPLLILHPMSASVIIAEGIITYWIANLVAERLPRSLSYAEIFGRDRFFALILISVAVRLIFDGFLLPELGNYLSAQGFEYDYRNNLHSFGLIIVALIANQMWNGGLRQGCSAMLLYVGITYVLVRFVLMEYTNFNISTLSYMYEDLASSILASPKAYIILLVSAFIASRMNLKYGWEFNGILIPSLLALQWYQPDKLVITLAESLIIYLIAAGLLRLAFFKKLHIEGPKQILLFFNISFLYKMALGAFLVTFMPNIKVSDFYAFGYLLSTLLALKMYQQDIAIRIARSTLQVSLVGVLAASLIGFILTLLPSGSTQFDDSQTAMAPDIQSVDADLNQYINKLRVTLYDSQRNNLSGQAAPLELDQLNQFFSALKNYLHNSQADSLNTLSLQAHALRLRLTWLNERYLIVEDSQLGRGWGVFLFDTNSDSQLVIEVPAPMDELQVTEAAASLFQNLSARGLALAGKKRRQAADGTSDTLKNPQTAFQIFHRHFGTRNALQIRQYTPESSRSLLGISSENTTQFLGLRNNQLWVKKTLPEDLNISVLDAMTGQLDVQWRPAPLENRQQDISPQGFAELFLSPAGIKNILSYAPSTAGFSVKEGAPRIDGYLLNWINANGALIASKGSNTYQPATLSEILFLDQNIVTPILTLLADDLTAGWNEEARPDIQRINDLALTLNYQLILYHHESSDEDYLILQEADLTQMRHWGTYVFRIGPAAPYVIEIPRPLAERNTLTFGANFYERLDAGVLLIAGSHPYANRDGTANLLHNANRVSLFNLVHEAVLREAQDSPRLVLQMRAFSDREKILSTDTDLLLAKLGAQRNDYPALTGPLETFFTRYSLQYEYVQGALGTMGYDVSWNAQARYFPFTRNKPFYVLWVSPDTRDVYSNQEDNRQQRLKFAAMGINSLEVDVPIWAGGTSGDALEFEEINFSALHRFLETENIVSLQQFIQRHRHFDFHRIVDIDTGQAFLAIQHESGYLAALVNLKTHSEREDLIAPLEIPPRELVQQFIDERARWLIRGEG